MAESAVGMAFWAFVILAVMNAVLSAIDFAHGNVFGWIYAGTTVLWIAVAYVQLKRTPTK